jgi:hypothetical protein
MPEGTWRLRPVLRPSVPRWVPLSNQTNLDVTAMDRDLSLDTPVSAGRFLLGTSWVRRGLPNPPLLLGSHDRFYAP